MRLKRDLEARGHAVWVAYSEMFNAGDWRNKVKQRILESETVVAFLSKHAVRDPGVCLTEIAIAMAGKSDDAIVAVLVEPEREVKAPSPIAHMQWLNMADHFYHSDDEHWYQRHFEDLMNAVERPNNRAVNRSTKREPT